MSSETIASTHLINILPNHPTLAFDTAHVFRPSARDFFSPFTRARQSSQPASSMSPAPQPPPSTLSLASISLRDKNNSSPQHRSAPTPTAILADAWDVCLEAHLLASLLPPSDLAALAATNKTFQPFRFEHWQTQEKTIPERERRAWWVCLTSQRLSPYLTTKELCLAFAATAKPFRPFGRQPWRLRPRSWSPLLLQRMAKGKLQEVTWFELPGTFQGHTDSGKHIAFLHSLVPAFTRLPLLTQLHVCGLRVSLLAKILDEALPLALLPSLPPSSSQESKKTKGGGGGGGKTRLLVLDAGTHASRQATVYPTPLFHNLTSLHTLRLSGRYQVLPCLARAIRGGHLPRLENLDVSWAWLEAKDLRPLHRAVEDVTEGGNPILLRRLDMSNNTLDDAAVEMLISVFENTERTIEQVRLEGNRFTREGKKALGGSAAAIVNDRVGKGMTLLL